MNSVDMGSIAIAAAASVREVSERNNLNQLEVLIKFTHSNTYALLLNVETGLYAVGHYVISNMFEEEIGLRQRKPSV